MVTYTEMLDKTATLNGEVVLTACEILEKIASEHDDKTEQEKTARTMSLGNWGLLDTGQLLKSVGDGLSGAGLKDAWARTATKPVTRMEPTKNVAREALGMHPWLARLLGAGKELEVTRQVPRKTLSHMLTAAKEPEVVRSALSYGIPAGALGTAGLAGYNIGKGSN